jgi:catabolite regulation protein CreA
VATALAVSVMAVSTPAVLAAPLASFEASGVFFKDSIDVTVLDDPLVENVTLYLSDFRCGAPLQSAAEAALAEAEAVPGTAGVAALCTSGSLAHCARGRTRAQPQRRVRGEL